jgi:Transposase DDE domain
MKMPDGGFRPGYNIQLAVAGKETGGPRTIVGVDVTNLGSDMGAVTKMIDEVSEMTGAVPKHILADGNHVRHACLDAAAARGVDVIAPPSKRSNARANDSAAVTAWRKRMTMDDAKRLYRGRAALVELANAHLKSNFGLDRVLVRGLGKVLCVGIIAALTFNIVQHAAAFT